MFLIEETGRLSAGAGSFLKDIWSCSKQNISEQHTQVTGNDRNAVGPLGQQQSL